MYEKKSIKVKVNSFKKKVRTSLKINLIKVVLRPTLMGTKNLNLYESGPNPFFYSGPKVWSESNLWQRFCFGMVSTINTSLSLSMRGRYNNEIAE